MCDIFVNLFFDRSMTILILITLLKEFNVKYDLVNFAMSSNDGSA